jgi:hypothetical protein
VAVNASADIFGYLTFEKLRRTSGELDNFHSSLYFTSGVRQNFAVFRGDYGGQFVYSFLDDPEEIIENSCAS